MGSKPTKVNDRDVPAHNPLMNNDHLRMHYFKDRKEADETQIRQENHFTIINKNGVVDNGRTLVGLRKPGHKSKIYFIRKRPKKFGPQEDSSVDDSASENMERIRKSSMSSFSQSEHLSLPDHQIDQSANMFDSQYVNEDQRMIIDERDSEFSDEQDPIRHSRLSKKQSNHEYLDTEEDRQIINVNTDRNKNNSQGKLKVVNTFIDVSSRGRQVTFEDNKRDESDSDGELSAHNQSSDGEELSAHNQPSDEEQEIVKPNEKIKSQPPMENFRDSENSGDQELSQEEVQPQQQLPEQEVEEVKQIHPPSDDEKEDSINEPQQIESDHKQEEVKRQQQDSDSDKIEDFKEQEQKQESDEEEKEIEPKITKIVVADQENSFEDVQNDSVYREDRKEELNERSPLVHTKEDVTDAQLNSDHIQSVPFEEQENVAEQEKVVEKASPSPKKKKKKRGKKKRVRANEQPLEEVEEPEIPEDNNSDNDA